MQLGAAALVAGVILLIVVLSGGSDADSDAAANFRTKAQAVCATAQRQVDELKTPSSLAGLVSVARRAARISGRTRAALAALDAPEDVSADVPALLTSLRRQQRLTNQLASAAARGSRTDVRRLIVRGQQEDVRTGQAAQRIGLEACATTQRDP